MYQIIKTYKEGKDVCTAAQLRLFCDEFISHVPGKTFLKKSRFWVVGLKSTD